MFVDELAIIATGKNPADMTPGKNLQSRKRYAAGMSKPIETHSELCDAFALPYARPYPGWKPYVVRSTIVEIHVEGKRIAVFGGAIYCGNCGYGVDAYTPRVIAALNAGRPRWTWEN